jgi:4-amino-4-deoxychorismate lyase
MERSLNECFNSSLQFDPEALFEKESLKNSNLKGLFKFRLLYNEHRYKTEFVPYSLPHIRLLKPVFADDIIYNCKFSDRSKLNILSSQKGRAHDVLIIKNGLVTDTSFANIIFYDGNEWITPDTPLLRGTQREYLLRKGLIREVPVRYHDIQYFKEARIINAMIRMEDRIIVKML